MEQIKYVINNIGFKSKQEILNHTNSILNKKVRVKDDIEFILHLLMTSLDEETIDIKIKYRYESIINKIELTKINLTSEDIYRKQIHQLIQEIPYEDLIKVFTIEEEKLPQIYDPLEIRG